MSFINPLILGALAFLAVPIILQFFVNRKKIVLYWAAYEWMKNAHVVKRKNVKINEILKLIAKLLLILFLVIFLARCAVSTGSKGTRLIIVDTTFSMSATMDEKTRLEVAKDIVQKIMSTPDSATVICSFNGVINTVAKVGAGQGLSPDALRGLEISPNSAGMGDFITAIASFPEAKNIQNIYFISDFQKCFFADAKATKEAMDRIGKGRNLVFVPVDTRTGLLNAGIVSFSSEPEGFFPGCENEIQVKVKNYSAEPMEAIPLTLTIDGKKQDRSIVSLKPKEEKTLQLSITALEPKDCKGSLTLPPDNFAPDNVLNFVISPGKDLSVLAVVKDKGEELFDFDIFMAGALKSFCPPEFLRYKRTYVTQLSEENLENYDIVIFFGIPIPDNSIIATSVKNFLAKRKSLICFSDCSETYTLKGIGVETNEVKKEIVKLDVKMLKGTYLAFLGEGDLDPLSVSFFKYCTIKNPTGANGRLFIQGSTDPLMAYREINGGKVLLAGFMPYPGFTDVFYNPNYVQFNMRMIWDIYPKRVFNAYLGREVESISLDNTDSDLKYSITGDTGSTTKLEMKGTGPTAKLSTSPMTVNDFFTVYAGGDPVSTFGYTVSREDSEIEPAHRNDYGEAIKEGLYFDEKHDFSSMKSRKEYMALGLVLLLLALAFENYAHFWRKKG
ncbi:MAG TPA: hypothetical protein DCZ94_01715 [Lentisphaeria bacterium]|nr:MAG: hypothetical protein A2X48_21595 [Lentisphaerae bacterium GWF2_49_21]HBC85649.1 hypothetical protein [Lentisphaeria bacterium]